MYSTIHKLFDKIKKMKKIEIFFCDFNFRLMLYFFCFLHIHNTWKSGSGQSHQKKRKKSEAMKFSFLLRLLLNYNFFSHGKMLDGQNFFRDDCRSCIYSFGWSDQKENLLFEAEIQLLFIWNMIFMLINCMFIKNMICVNVWIVFLPWNDLDRFWCLRQNRKLK